MRAELREQILAYNRAVAASREQADDLMTILGALPPGQAKNLLKNEIIGPILEKYGVTEQEAEGPGELSGSGC